MEDEVVFNICRALALVVILSLWGLSMALAFSNTPNTPNSPNDSNEEDLRNSFGF